VRIKEMIIKDQMLELSENSPNFNYKKYMENMDVDIRV